MDCHIHELFLIIACVVLQFYKGWHRMGYVVAFNRRITINKKH